MATNDVGPQDSFPRSLGRMAAEMHDTGYSLDGLLHRAQVCEVGGDEFLVRRQVGRRHEIAEPQVVDTLEKAAQPPADIARGPGNQNCFHGSVRSGWLSRTSCCLSHFRSRWRQSRKEDDVVGQRDIDGNVVWWLSRAQTRINTGSQSVRR